MLVLMRLIRSGAAALVFAGVLAMGGIAFAALGQPSPWQMGFQQSAAPTMDDIVWFHNFVLYIIIGITIFVLALLLTVILKFNARANPAPSRTTHNTLLEVLWTVIPVMILVVIAVPSFRLLYYGDKAQDAAMTVKVTGHQWYWSYEYPDQGNFSVDSRILPEADRAKLKPNQPRMLAVDEEMVIPSKTVIRVIGTAADSMHGWTVWGFGIKKTVIPGRLNEGWIEVPEEGIYFGQCSQICGQDHSYMPIAVRVVSKADFDAWVAQKKKAAGLLPESGLASVDRPAHR